MLKGLSPLLSPDLLHVLASMGHGDEIVLADANFPAATHARRLVALAGADAPQVLDAVLSVMPLDDFVEQAAFTMQVVSDPTSVPEVVQGFNTTLQRQGYGASVPIERFAFYQRAAAAFAIVATGERRVYGNILLKKGVVRP
jgi:L-fucose mutarotase